ncbi:MAG: primosomal protein N', partial [Deltaproteobacteria bacterium]|nr:primosomal protein N' [Deltaproteobacteria bacterium]
KQVLKNQKQVIFLVPEIGLTPQLLGRLQSRLQERIAVYHSGQTDAWRQKTWQEIKDGKIRVALGTRSALFAPFKNLGAIIVDEEHDASYKQEDSSLRYHARDAAVVRAKLEKATVVLGSATPSLETVHNCKEGKYEYICLTKRPTGAQLPTITMIDLRKEKFSPDSQTLSLPLQEAISENLYRREQTLLLLNRRGFANFLLCEECGTAVECPNCAISLTYHKTLRSLVCHYCEYKQGLPQTCGQCQSADIKLVGLGTQRLEEELHFLFPRAVISRLDQDTTAKREVRNTNLQKMKRGEIDILLGTQLVAKGHDFPNVTLVGVISADSTLHLPDFRSAERNFQLLTQVAGRSGRDKKPGRVLIQTFQPEHFSLACAQEHNFEKFYERELKGRHELNYPPFSRLTQIRIEGASEEGVKQLAFKIKTLLSAMNLTSPQSGREGEALRALPAEGATRAPTIPLQILGPAKAPLSKIRGKYRWQILLKTKNRAALNACLQAIQPWREKSPLPSTQIQIDVDCMNTM